MIIGQLDLALRIGSASILVLLASLLLSDRRRVGLPWPTALSLSSSPCSSLPTIRDETVADERAIFQLTKRAFAPMPFSDGDEQHLINALRRSGVLAISMVAVQGNRVVGHIAFSPAKCRDQDDKWFALGPVAVEPELQGQKIGSALIEAGIKRLKGIHASGCILTGDPKFYSRFGFKPFPALCPPGEPPEYFMILPLLCASPSEVVQFHPLFHSAAGGSAN